MRQKSTRKQVHLPSICPLRTARRKCGLHGPRYSSEAGCCCYLVAQLFLTLCDPRDCSMPGFPVLHHLSEFTLTHVHWVKDTIQPSHLLLSPPPPTFYLSQHQGLFQWLSSSLQVAKVLALQLQHQSFQWILRIDFLVWSPCYPRDSQESSPTPQFKSINSLALSHLCGPTHIHTWLLEKKKHSFLLFCETRRCRKWKPSASPRSPTMHCLDRYEGHISMAATICVFYISTIFLWITLKAHEIFGSLEKRMKTQKGTKIHSFL